MAITYGRVPHPDFLDRLIPDAFNRAWNDLGPRVVKGVVFHRMLGSLMGTDGYFRSVPPGGCPPGGDPTFRYGGCNGLTDWGVDAVSGLILRWNDPTGAAHVVTGEDGVRRTVSANRAPHASGPVSSPYGDGLAFLEDHGWDLSIVNRDQASIEISGGYDDPISDACTDSVAALSAFYADQRRIPWDSYPLLPGKSYNFTRWHEEFTRGTGKPCPGAVVKAATGEIIERTVAILRRYQEGAVSEPTTPGGIAYPKHLDKGLMARLFGSVKGEDGRTYAYDEGGPITETWRTHYARHGWPAIKAVWVYDGGKRRYVIWESGPPMFVGEDGKPVVVTASAA